MSEAQLGPQLPLARTQLLNAATGDTTSGTHVKTEGMHGSQVIEVNKTGTGTCTVTPMGLREGGSTWYAIGCQRVDGQGTLTRSGSGIAVGATNPLNMVIQLLDYYPTVRLDVSGSGGSFSLNAWIDGMPA